MAYSTEFLATQSRKQLQSLAKENFIKANSTNADIILALQSVGSDCAEVSAVVVALDTSNISKVEANSPESKPREGTSKIYRKTESDLRSSFSFPHISAGCNEINVKEEILVGSHVEVLIENCWIQAVVRKINPKTYRISMSLDRSEQLTKHGNVRMLQLTATSLPVAKSAIVDAPDTELCGTVDLNLQKVEQSRPEENSEKRKRSSSNTSRVTNGSVSSANEDKAPLSKKRSFVAITSNKQQPQQAISVILQQEKRRTISSNAPLNYLPRPSVLPKATKPQHIQQDSLLTLQGKATALKSASSNAITTKAVRRDSCTPHNKIMDSAPRPQFQKKTISRLSVSRSEQIKSLQNIESTTVSASSSTAVVFSTSTPSKLKNGVPDFQKMHQRMMSNLKPITAIVKRVRIDFIFTLFYISIFWCQTS